MSYVSYLRDSARQAMQVLILAVAELPDEAQRVVCESSIKRIDDIPGEYDDMLDRDNVTP